MKLKKHIMSTLLLFSQTQSNLDTVYITYRDVLLKQVKIGMDAWMNNSIVKTQMGKMLCRARDHFQSAKSHLTENQKQRALYELEYIAKAIESNTIYELVKLTNQLESDIASQQQDDDKAYPYQFEVSHKGIMLSKNFKALNVVQFYGEAAYGFRILNAEDQRQALELQNLLNQVASENQQALDYALQNYGSIVTSQQLIDEMKRIRQCPLSPTTQQPLKTPKDAPQHLHEVEKNLENWEKHCRQQQIEKSSYGPIDNFKARQCRYAANIIRNRVAQQLIEAPTLCAVNSCDIPGKLQNQVNMALALHQSSPTHVSITNALNQLSQKINQKISQPTVRSSNAETILFYFREYQKIMELLAYTEHNVINEADFSLNQINCKFLMSKSIFSSETQVMHHFTDLEKEQYKLFKQYVIQNQAQQQSASTPQTAPQDRPQKKPELHKNNQHQHQLYKTGLKKTRTAQEQSASASTLQDRPKKENHTTRNLLIAGAVSMSAIAVATAVYFWHEKSKTSKNKI